MTLTLLGPFILSFDKRVAFYKNWKFLLVPFIITATYFIIWDSWFTKIGVWSFNELYVLDFRLLRLPLEEWLFFFFVPYACLHIYEVANSYIRRDILGRHANTINLIILIIVSITGVLNFDKAYTAFNFLSAATLLAIIQFMIKPKWLGRFYIGYFISLIPFLIVNGILTYLPVVSYNNQENLGIRIFTIPIEDTIYCLLLLLMNVTMYEWMKGRAANS
jgi:lycopene cyclase domain-containing protein